MSLCSAAQFLGFSVLQPNPCCSGFPDFTGMTRELAVTTRGERDFVIPDAMQHEVVHRRSGIALVPTERWQER